MSLEEAAIIEQKHAQSQPKRPPRQKEFGGISEKERHAIIMEYMCVAYIQRASSYTISIYRNHKDSDDDEEYDEDEDEKEFWYGEGKLADDDDTGAVGGEWVDSSDLSRMIAVDKDRITAGGYYTNFMDDP